MADFLVEIHDTQGRPLGANPGDQSRYPVRLAFPARQSPDDESSLRLCSGQDTRVGSEQFNTSHGAEVAVIGEDLLDPCVVHGDEREEIVAIHWLGSEPCQGGIRCGIVESQGEQL